MKLNHQTTVRLVAPVILLSGILSAALTADEIVLERGPDHRVIQVTQPAILPDGSLGQKTNRLVVLETGMHFWKDGKWEETVETIQADPGGAAALKGPNATIFGPNLNEAGAIKFTADGRDWRSQPLCIAYLDRRSGKIAAIATVKDCEGWIMPPNSVVYFDCFQGLRADYRISYRKIGIEADIVLRDPLPDPATVIPGANAKDIEVQVITEFLNPPQPQVKVRAAKREKDPAVRVQMAFPDWQDYSIAFGRVSFGRGQAFAWPQAGQKLNTFKRWETVDQRTFLVESVGYPELAEAMKGLNRPGAALPKVNLPIAMVNGLPQYPGSMANKRTIEKELALASPAQRQAFAQPGYLLDYQLNAGNYGDFTFDGGTEYLVTGGVNFSGTVVFEAGTIIKFARTNSPSLFFSSSSHPSFQGKPYQPVFLTSVDDNSVGSSGSTNTPVRNFVALDMSDGCVTADIKYLRIAYADGAMVLNPNECSVSVNHCQFTYCNYGLVIFGDQSTPLSANNLLFYGVNTVLTGGDYLVRGAHWTANSITNYFVDDWGGGVLYLTNSLIANWQALGSGFNTNNNYKVYTSGITFTNVVAGWHYLPTNSSFRNSGTTNLPASLLADLQKKTVTAPLVYSNTVFSTDTNLGPTVDLDANPPDLGYHYDPLDYLFYGTQATNCSLSITGGVAIAMHGGPGVWVNGGSKIISKGLAKKPNVYTIYPAVQEQPMAWGSAPLNTCFNSWHTNGADPEMTFEFTDIRGFNTYIVYTTGDGRHVTKFKARHSNFVRGTVYLGGANATNDVINCLFEYGTLFAQDDSTGIWRNNLFYKNIFFSLDSGANPWLLTDNVFDQSTVLFFGNTTNTHNVYVGTNDRLTPTNGTEVILTNLTYVAGLLGNYYLSTNQNNLINSGSVTNAGLVGLYHFCTTTNQVKEASGVLDRGLHYVALDAYGNPVDTDGDGEPDYLEDANGNGVLDASLGETDWQTYTTLWSTNSPGLQVFTPLK